MPCASKAIIIGGGIAGLSCAIALARVGVFCTILERGNPKEGASIGVSGRATNAAEELGLYERLYREGMPFEKGNGALDFRNAAGDIIAKSPSDPYGSETRETVGVYRPTWIKIMTEAAIELGVEIKAHTTFTAIDNRMDGVTVTTSSGEILEADFLVGADGVSSATRGVIIPDGPEPQYSGQFSMRWMAPGPRIQPESMYMSPEGRLGFYYLPEDIVYVASVMTVPEGERLTEASTAAHFRELLQSMTAPALQELRSRLRPDSEIIARPFRWILLPDRCTAHMGQGGGMALEDSAVLAQCIRDYGSVEQAFEAFMKRRYHRVSTVVHSSVELSKLEQRESTPEERALYRNQAMAAIAVPY
ncbi:hypothetical protein M409DRAFT_20727 [Zasmidium cellare ATCC 36951]|uniref:FAD-binding domain-containing protein n=1 Tax=Zasmidium cellare ATCC 36951 TaxID=1080233 RepID=A0A6A6CRE6_ZASCE|nr:uncharacterized protein M409DRAFT_20727 [Zasmidium cellare ATCC 36951]KAF2168710.1 hypothetical protein M409DRAFT_20727 [Zasmidium cellare ATCC 36951]